MAVAEKNSSKRMFGVALGIFRMAATIAVKLTNIQWNEGDYYKKLAKDRTVKTFVIPANKGNIYSADGSLLATPIPNYTIRFDAVAMEFLAGPTLRTWHKDQVRTWRDSLRLLCQAGEGLAAAHAGGIIHRDFKPQNAMLGADGRVRVLDFGIARLGEADAAGEAASPPPLDAPERGLTMTGTVLGTPAYIAPEQFRGAPPDPRTDQFAFCVTAWQLLTGGRPCHGSSLDELEKAAGEGGRFVVDSWFVDNGQAAVVPELVRAVKVIAAVR